MDADHQLNAAVARHVMRWRLNTDSYYDEGEAPSTYAPCCDETERTVWLDDSEIGIVHYFCWAPAHDSDDFLTMVGYAKIPFTLAPPTRRRPVWVCTPRSSSDKEPSPGQDAGIKAAVCRALIKACLGEEGEQT
jgi:hypothetical protein